MDSFEWMELETLNSEIAHAQTRLAAARSAQNHRLVQLLQREIDETAERRDRVLANITQGLSPSRAGAPPRSSEAPAAAQDGQRPQAKPVKPAKHTAHSGSSAPDPSAPGGSPPSRPAAATDTATHAEGVAAVWDRLTATDIEQAKRGLAQRRSELLARHAEELKALDAEQGEIDNFEQSIGAFARKFNLAGAKVVALDAERSPAS
jgi:hypothetical protein